MATPPTAKKLGTIRDPSDIKPIGIDYSAMLNPGEKIGSFTLLRSAAAIAAGMDFATGSGRDPAIIGDGLMLTMWPVIDPGEAANPIFASNAGAGVPLDFEATVVTDSVPPRTDQQTFTIQWAQR